MPLLQMMEATKQAFAVVFARSRSKLSGEDQAANHKIKSVAEYNKTLQLVRVQMLPITSSVHSIMLLSTFLSTTNVVVDNEWLLSTTNAFCRQKHVVVDNERLLSTTNVFVDKELCLLPRSSQGMTRRTRISSTKKTFSNGTRTIQAGQRAKPGWQWQWCRSLRL